MAEFTDLDLTCDETAIPQSPVNVSKKSDLIIAENFREPEEEEHLPPVKAIRDRKLLSDSRVLRNMLRSQKHCVPKAPNYMKEIQPDLTPSMRKTVTEWMLQVG